jgi:hypothetical protein
MTPLEVSFGKIDGRRDWLTASIGDPPDGWFRADRLAADPGEVERLRTAIVAQFGAVDPRTDGVMLMWRYADTARVATMVFAHDRRVPDLRPGAVAFDPGTNDVPAGVAYASPQFGCLVDDPDAGHPDALPVASLDELRGDLVRRLEAFFAPAIEPLRLATHLGRKALWGIAASVPLVAVAHALAEVADPETGIREVEAILGHSSDLAISPPAFEVVTHRGARHLVVRDGACCRAYLRPEAEMCTSCPILMREERLARVLEFLDRDLPGPTAA